MWNCALPYPQHLVGTGCLALIRGSVPLRIRPDGGAAGYSNAKGVLRSFIRDMRLSPC
jgi:hypothetical protein